MEYDTSLAAYIIAGFIFQIIIAIICSNKAGALNRNKVGWFMFGLFVPLLALVILLFMTPKVKSSFVPQSTKIANKHSNNDGSKLIARQVQQMFQRIGQINKMLKLTQTTNREIVLTIKAKLIPLKDKDKCCLI